MKKYLKFSIAFFAFVILGFAGVKVFAESSSANTGSGSLSSGGPMIVNVGPNGNVLMRGIVIGAPSTDSIVVKSWGGSWKVAVSSTTQLMSLNKAVADFQDGDFVGVQGVVSSDGSFTVDAKVVREWRSKADHEKIDSDNDDIPNNQDLDDDNDGILDIFDSKPFDHDDDGIADLLDSDDDDDGIDDSQEESKHEDHDNDGLVDSRDSDDDNDGISDAFDSKKHDHDNDGSDDDEDDDNKSGSNERRGGDNN